MSSVQLSLETPLWSIAAEDLDYVYFVLRRHWNDALRLTRAAKEYREQRCCRYIERILYMDEVLPIPTQLAGSYEERLYILQHTARSISMDVNEAIFWTRLGIVRQEPIVVSTDLDLDPERVFDVECD